MPRLAEFEGTSVYYAATAGRGADCAAATPVAVVGGGNSAGQAALFLARHAAVVRLIIRATISAATMSRYLVDQIERLPNIEVLRHTEVRELIGDEVAGGGRRGGQPDRGAAPADAGRCSSSSAREPCTGWLADQVALDRHGLRAHRRRRDRGALARTARTTPPAPTRPAPSVVDRPAAGDHVRGVFAVGDVRSGSVKRVASAVGEGVDGGPAGARAPGQNGRLRRSIARPRPAVDAARPSRWHIRRRSISTRHARLSSPASRKAPR